MKFDDVRYQQYPDFLARIKELAAERDAQLKELKDRANSPTVEAGTLMQLVKQIDYTWSQYRQQVEQAKAKFGVPTSWVGALAEVAASAKTGKAEYRPLLSSGDGNSLKATMTQNNVTGTVTVEMHETYTISMDAEQAIDQINSYLTDKGLKKDAWVPVRLESEAGLTHSRER